MSLPERPIISWPWNRTLGQDRLAAARLAHDAEGLAALELERHAVDGAHQAARGPEPRLEVGDLDDGTGVALVELDLRFD
jgi:hypothetical protein